MKFFSQLIQRTPVAVKVGVVTVVSMLAFAQIGLKVGFLVRTSDSTKAPASNPSPFNPGLIGR